MDRHQLEQWQRADQVLDQLLDLPAEQRRPALRRLDIDDELRQIVRHLLDAGDVDAGVLENPGRLFEGSGGEGSAGEGSAGEDGPDLGLLDLGGPDLGGRRFGPFVLEREIGRGGMSVVYLARRAPAAAGDARPGTPSFDQRVALKILTLAAALTPGARLQREMAVLARLRHPHIATLIDAGVEADGTRWLAMEWVDGRSIERFCEHFEPRRSVELVLEVCEAVDYAHRNLIVHRDLKPSNILVDGEGHVRLLDFGIAKLLDDPGSPGTREATRALTPSYAAPEQFLGGAVTTATDVFGLGAVLFRLLAGQPPRQHKAGLEPAAVDFSKLPAVDRDLATIVRTCLQDEAERRYNSVALLREDLERWLGGRPIRAAGESTLYRLRKLIGRHRTLAVISSLLVLAVAAGTFSTYRQAQRARQQAEVATREAERSKAISGFLLDLFSFADPDHSQGESLTVRQALDAGARQLEVRLEGEPRLRAELLGTVGEIYRRLGLYDDAEPLHDKAVELSAGGPIEARAQLRRARLALSRFESVKVEESLEKALADPALRSEALQVLAVLRQAERRSEEAVSALEEALGLEESRDEVNAEAVAAIHLALADVVFDQGNLERAGELSKQALELTRAAYDGEHTALAAALESAGAWAFEVGDEEEAIDKLGEALAMRERLLGEEHPDVAYTLGQIAQVERRLGRFEKAEIRLRRALELQRARLGPDHPDAVSTVNSLALLAYDRGDLETSVALLEQALASTRRAWGPSHRTAAELLTNLGATRRALGDFDRAQADLEEALEIYSNTLGEQTLDVGHCYNQLGNLERARGRLDEAERLYRRGLASIEAATGATHPEALASRANLAGLAFERRQYRDAVAEFERAHGAARDALPADHPLRIVIATRLARSLLRTPRAAEALPLTEAALEIVLERYPPDAARRLETEAVHGGALLAAGRRADGERVLQSVASRLEAGAMSKSALQEISRWRTGSDPE